MLIKGCHTSILLELPGQNPMCHRIYSTKHPAHARSAEWFRSRKCPCNILNCPKAPLLSTLSTRRFGSASRWPRDYARGLIDFSLHFTTLLLQIFSKVQNLISFCLLTRSIEFDTSPRRIQICNITKFEYYRRYGN